MEDVFYNILWIDDEHEALGGTKGRAKRNGINLVAFKSLNSGMNELERNYPKYDGVLLDAKFFENDDDVKGSEDTENVHRAKERLLSLKKKFEVFVLTGQAEAYDDSTFKKAFPKVYRKGSDQEIDRLFIDIIESASNQIDTQIRHENAALFNALESYEIEHQKTILQIFRSMRNVGSELDDNLYFTALRIILEQVFRKANAIGLLHDKCVQIKGSHVNLTESSKFLAGEDCNILKVRCSKNHFPKIIAESVKNLLFITGAASHTSEVDITKNIDVQTYRSDLNTPYLLYQLVFMLADVIIWLHNYSKENSDNSFNKSLWEEFESFTLYNNQVVEGELIKIAGNGWGTVNLKKTITINSVSVYKDKVAEENLSEGDNVSLTLDSVKAKTIEKIKL